MHSFLITGGNNDDRLNYVKNKLSEWQVCQFDLHQINFEEESSIGIKDIRELIQKLILNPVNSQFIVAVITPAEKLTIEAQNALLKTLEEPPNKVKLFLLTNNINELLPTILSRCQIINLTNLPAGEAGPTNLANESLKPTLSELTSLTLGQRLNLLEPIVKDRQTAQNWIQQSIINLHNKFDKNDKDLQFYAKIMRQLLQAESLIAKNISPRLCLNVFASKIPRQL